jgi:hypothetical protein
MADETTRAVHDAPEGLPPPHTHSDYADGFDAGKAQERERCARIADDEARIRREAGQQHPEDSEARGRCFAAARAAVNVAKGIRSGEVVAGVGGLVAITAMVDAAMAEMSNIHPPLRRSECERLIRAALGVKSCGEVATPCRPSREQVMELAARWHDENTLGGEECEHRQLELVAYVEGYFAAGGRAGGDAANVLHTYTHGTAVCDDCGHTWVAVWPLGADELECPKCHSTNTDRTAETNVDRGLNRQARKSAAPASNGPMVENPQGFQEGAPRSRGAHGKVGTPDQHHMPKDRGCSSPPSHWKPLEAPDGVEVPRG